MHYLYGSKRGGPSKLVATFGSEQMLLAYVRWATLEAHEPQRGKFEQGSALASLDAWTSSREPLTAVDPSGVVHNPTPSML
jgi:hypothetical protein